MNSGAVLRIAGLVASSGFCALVYQVAWLRELRLVFGGSTAASAAVLAIFMAGLGIGGARLGRRADAHVSPLRLYSNLEWGIAISAALSPFLLGLVREIYIGLGGTMVLGSRGATLVRLFLAALVLGVPTFLMGGTLPAVARAAATSEDTGRRSLALLYGANTLGAVCGAFLSSFYMLELFGTRTTLWLACLLNLAVAVVARAYARRLVSTASDHAESGDRYEAAAPPWFVLVSAGVVGFAFLLMELVWYRMLSPLLGGSTYTFGLILTLALLGIGAGSVAYGVLGQRGRPTLRMFGLTVALEALFIAIPFALGDRLAVLTQILRGMSAMGFFGQVSGWALVTAIIVLPAAFVSGYQFPLLIGLLGKGSANVGRHTGLAYACNTAGAIIGSLAGGFGVLPLLGAVNTWRYTVVLLGLLAAATVYLVWRQQQGQPAAATPDVPARVRRGVRALRAHIPESAFALLLIAMLFSAGPTAVWRHGSIGAGRSPVTTENRNDLIKSMYDLRRQLVWERDGVESSVGLQVVSGISFLLNGKNDGNARFDASTQVTLGLLSALFHERPRDAFVIGLGTGSSAGWLGAVDTIERVDVAELEPAILEMARRCTPVNHDVMADPKVQVIAGDARELLLTAPRSYDLIVSEPSNPFRAGISSLYTTEFYEAVRARLNEGGMFSQWVQAYEIDTQTFRTIYATLSSVFDFVETWQTNDLDLVIICSERPIFYDVDRLRERMQLEPFKSALLHTWAVTDFEGLLSRYVANFALPKQVGLQEGDRLNTDDRMLVEFGFARTVGQDLTFSANELRNSAYEFGALRPLTLRGEVDWREVEEQRLHMSTLQDHTLPVSELNPEEQRRRIEAFAAYLEDDLAEVLSAWKQQSREPKYYLELAMVGEALAEVADPRSLVYADKLRPIAPVEAEAIRARFLLRTDRATEAADALVNVYKAIYEDPWPLHKIMVRAIKLAQDLAAEHRDQAPKLLAAMSRPFAVGMHEEVRAEMAIDLASKVSSEAAVPYLEAYEPNVIWTEEFLTFRAQAYRATEHPRARLAERQLAEFHRNKPQRFSDVMNAKSPAQAEVAERVNLGIHEAIGTQALAPGSNE